MLLILEFRGGLLLHQPRPMRALGRAQLAAVTAAAAACACSVAAARSQPQPPSPPPPLHSSSGGLDRLDGASPAMLVFSGGTAMNSLAAPLSTISPRISHVLPVSDDGGSTAEIVRVLGGPAVGDIRSRCLRLSDVSTPEAVAVKRLLQHRLPTDDRAAARAAWLSIVEGTHPLWHGIESPFAHTIRAFLVHFHTALLVHAAHDFDFSGGSVGNFFFAGARMFLNSLNAAIFLYSRVSGVPRETAVLPVLRSETDKRVVLGAELDDGSLIRGQNTISHPPAAAPPRSRSPNPIDATRGPGATSAMRKGVVEKERSDSGGAPPLPSPIRRVLYISSDYRSDDDHERAGDAAARGGAPRATAAASVAEVHPPINPLVVKKLRQTDVIIYGCGSLYTSICPSLIVRGVGEEIAASRAPKILMLNGYADRETQRGPGEPPMTASDVVRAVVRALNREASASPLAHPASTYVDVLLYPSGCDAHGVAIDHAALRELGVRAVEVGSTGDERGRPRYTPTGVVAALCACLNATQI